MRYFSRKGNFLRFISVHCRPYSSWKGEVTVYRSLSHNPFENLAFEDWVYLNVDLTDRRVLFLWRNEPTVVIGRHQNPWAECNIKNLWQHNVYLARRKSGGGTVYHDLGNVNLTFFTPRALYNRKENLELIVNVLRDRWKLNVESSPRDDILLDGKFKSSSSKLGRSVSFHHCTLLCDVDQLYLKFLLQSSYADISSKATASVRSDVANLCTKDPSINYHTVTEAVSQGFYQKYNTGQQIQITDVDPSQEADFPGITVMKKELQDWHWLYGKTPRFSVTFTTNLSSEKISLQITSYHGLVEYTQVNVEDEAMYSLLNELVSKLKGVKFQAGAIESVLRTHVNTPSLTALDRQLCNDFVTWIVSVL